MVIEKFTFFREKDEAGESNVLKNFNKGSMLTLGVGGDATAMQLRVKGIVDDSSEADWVDLGLINTATFAISTDIVSNGIYNVGCSGVSKIKVVIDSISGGDVTVVGKLID